MPDQQLDFQSILQYRPGLQIRLDWQAYYKEFERQHGGDPVIYKSRLLFRDGWTHSATDYRGPEWPAPDDPQHLRDLLHAYWSIRRTILKDEYTDLKLKIEALRDAQNLRSAPLQQVTQQYDPDKRSRVLLRFSVDLDILESRLVWVQGSIAECDRQLRLIEVSGDRSTKERPEEVA